MTGARITATLDDADFRAGLGRLAALTSNFEPLLKRIGVGMVKATQQHFSEATDPFGRAWHPLNPAYAADKRGPGILRESAMRGGLMGNLTYQVQGPRAVAWGSGKVYAAAHQFGAVIVPKRAKSLVFRIGGRVIHARRVVIPARPYLGMGPAEEREIMRAAAFTLEEALGGG